LWQFAHGIPGNHTNTTGNLAVNDRTTQAGLEDPTGAPSSVATPWRVEADSGIDVREEDLSIVEAQRLYQMRCECGRSWFELVLKTLVQCPACHKLGLVSLHPDPDPAMPLDEGKTIPVTEPSAKSGRPKRTSQRL
jgi:hypothetical protein